MIAPRSRAEPALPRTSRGRPSQRTIEGAIIEVSLSPTRPGPTRSASPSMLLTWTPVPGTTTPEPEPSDELRLAQSPFRSITDMWVERAARLASVELLRAALRYPFQRDRQIRVDDTVAGSPGAVRSVDGP